MSSSKDLFLAILSMDSYNRGYDARIADGDENDPDGLGEGGRIGSANVINPLSVGRTETVLKGWQDAGFYAAAYALTEAVDSLPAQTIVISYRGTNDLKDVWTDIQTITGVVGFPEQFRLAAKFYQAVKAANPGANIVLTGHSLGGALAGFVGSLYGLEAVLYNNISFEDTSDYVHDRAIVTDSDIQSVIDNAGSGPDDLALAMAVADQMREDRQWAIDNFYPDGNILDINRQNVISEVVPGDVAGDTRVFQTTPTDQVGSQNAATNLGAVPDFDLAGLHLEAIFGVWGFVLGRQTNLHWQSLLVIKQFSEDLSAAQSSSYSEINHWNPVYFESIRALFDNSLAGLAGVMENGDGDYSLMQKMIAYSALDEGSNLVFGDTAIRALFNDIKDLGIVYGSELGDKRHPLLNGFIDDGWVWDSSLKQALAAVAVEYAGALAYNKIETAKVTIPGKFEATDGVFSLTGDHTILTLDLSSVLWRDVLNSGKLAANYLADPIEIAKRDEILDLYVSQGKQMATNAFWDFLGYTLLDDLARQVWYARSDAIFDRIHIRTMADNTAAYEAIQLQDRPYDTRALIGDNAHVDIYVGLQDAENQIYDTKGNDLVIGGSKDDILYSTSGNDWLEGGGGNDRLIRVITRAEIEDSDTTGSIDGITFAGGAVEGSLLASFVDWLLTDGSSGEDAANEDVVSYSTEGAALPVLSSIVVVCAGRHKAGDGRAKKSKKAA